MKALLLAAGRGERLRPLTDEIPKCLVPINGRPLLQYWLDLVDQAGIEEFYINLHYRAQSVRDFILNTKYADRVYFLEEEELLGTGGTLKRNAGHFVDGPFFLAHADNLCLTDFTAFLADHAARPEGVAITMMTFDPPDPKQCGVVTLDGNAIVTAFHEKVEHPPTTLANGAVFVMEAEVARYAALLPETHFEISRGILPHYVGRMRAWHNDDYHLDIGTPETYQKAKNETEKIERLYKKYKN